MTIPNLPRQARPLKGLLPCLMALLLGLASLVMPPLLGQAQDSSTGPLVRNIRVGQDGPKTRIVFDIDEAVGHRWFTLPQPARLVVDFNADIGFAQEPSKVTLPEASQVKELRAGRFRPGTVRMVLDLKAAAKVSVFAIPGSGPTGQRLVIDVAPPKKGQKPTDVPPPADVVTSDAAPPVTPQQKAAEAEKAPVVPRQVVTRDDGQIVVVLDPGHGGVDPGACGRAIRLCEKGLTLKMARKIKDELQSRRIKVVLTRDTDIFIPLPERGRIAQRANADLFVSLHADSAPSPNVAGATVYMVSDRASDREAARLAASENDGDVLAGVALDKESREVQSILISLIQRETMNSAAYLAQNVLSEMGKVAKVRKPHVLFAGFKVLKTPDVPSILVEMGYLSNAAEERKLNQPDYQDRMAKAIARGIKRYVDRHVHR